MKTWNNFFEVNEDHIVDVNDKVRWINMQVKKLDDDQIENLYKYMEKEFKLKGK